MWYRESVDPEQVCRERHVTCRADATLMLQQCRFGGALGLPVAIVALAGDLVDASRQGGLDADRVDLAPDPAPLR